MQTTSIMKKNTKFHANHLNTEEQYKIPCKQPQYWRTIQNSMQTTSILKNNTKFHANSLNT